MTIKPYISNSFYDRAVTVGFLDGLELHPELTIGYEDINPAVAELLDFIETVAAGADEAEANKYGHVHADFTEDEQPLEAVSGRPSPLRYSRDSDGVITYSEDVAEEQPLIGDISDPSAVLSWGAVDKHDPVAERLDEIIELLRRDKP